MSSNSNADLLQYLSRMEKAVLNANKAISLLKTENASLKEKILQLEKKSVEIPPPLKRNRPQAKQKQKQDSNISSAAQSSWSGVDGFLLSQATRNEPVVVAVNQRSLPSTSVPIPISSSPVKKRPRSIGASAPSSSRPPLPPSPPLLLDNKEEHVALESTAISENIFEFSSSSDSGSDSCDETEQKEPTIDNQPTKTSHSSAKPFSTAEPLLKPEEEGKLKNVDLARALLRVLSDSNIPEVVARLRKIDIPFLAQALSGHISHTVGAALPYDWLAIDDTLTIDSAGLFPETVLASCALVTEVIVNLATVDPAGLQLAKRLLLGLKRRVEAMVRKRRPGSPLMWLLVGTEAVTALLSESCGEKHLAACQSTDTAHLDDNHAAESGPLLAKETPVADVASVSRSYEDREQGADETDEDEIEALKEEEGEGVSALAAQYSSKERSGLRIDAVFAMLLLTLSNAMLQLDAKALLLEFLFDITALISPDPRIGEILGILLVIQRIPVSYQPNLCCIYFSLEESINYVDTAHPLYISLVKELQRVRGAILSLDPENSPSCDLSDNLEELFAITRTAHTGSSAESQSQQLQLQQHLLLSNITLEARRQGVLTALITAHKKLDPLYADVKCTGLFEQCGLFSFGSILERIIGVFNCFDRTLVVPVEEAEWLAEGFLRNLLVYNAFEIPNITVDEFSDIHEIKKSYRKYFEQHWAGVLDSADLDAVRSSLVVLTAILRALFIDFSSTCTGWRAGPSGSGQLLSERLNARLQQARRDMEAADVPWSSFLNRSDAYPQRRKDEPTLWFLNLAPVTSITSAETLKHACNVFDSFMKSSIAMGVTQKCTSPEAEKVWGKLAYTMNDLLSIIILNLIERLVFLLSCCVLGLLDVLHFKFLNRPPDIMDRDCTLLTEIFSLMRIFPSPWANHMDSECLSDFLLLAELFGGEMPEELAKMLHNMAKKVPVYIINLSRRPDRWMRMLRLCESHGLVSIRVPAVDGNAVGAQKLVISEKDVVTKWDSTVNAYFDTNCVLNTATIMTASERACAMSHVNTWRMILHSNSGKGMNPILDKLLPLYKAAGSYFPCKPGNSSFSADSEKDDEWFLIFEDDSTIRDALEGELSNAVKLLTRKIPNDVDILYLGHVLPKNCTKTRQQSSKWMKPNYLWQLHAYLITKKTAEILINFLPVDGPVDNFIAKLVHDNILTAYALATQFVVQKNSKSLSKRQDSDIHHSGKS